MGESYEGFNMKKEDNFKPSKVVLSVIVFVIRDG